ncbi:phytanoyl-CoA dioxygenase [Mucilaginibacter limnophilus]|uniref:Phytanoyl-CoA dioxygenase n=1 Tax=Mucilaginibacter limnophilus TaxID=1932778 RepID=A0A437MLJ2_9SPHI|nr:phytanoyl-CoA dioxygenase [Mucilaginibacter limnophilus]RVT98466.1 phytanoyl-CoA dioxygenase [Mucilaginibacter limnophilus]
MSYLLSKKQIEQFIHDGFVRIDNAFSAELANAALAILWQDIPFDRFSPESWTEPVIRLGMYTQEPFIKSLNTPALYAVFDQLVGANKWIPCKSVGSFPVRFPAGKEPNDIGKHVDVSFPGDDPGNYFEWRANIKSKGRALLMLVLYSDVSSDDAPTVICKRSHLDVAKLLYPEGDRGLSFMDLAARLSDLPNRDEVLATGKAGTIYLCHPFLVHSAQSHKGTNPKFMAQPPLLLRSELNIMDQEIGFSPVEQAIRLAID